MTSNDRVYLNDTKQQLSIFNNASVTISHIAKCVTK